MSVGEAMSQLRLMDKGKSKLFYKLLKNAVNNLGLEEGEYDTYYVKDMLAEEAQKYYRVKPRARGAAFRIRRRYSRVKVLLDKKLN
jgi:ribosomal protein L22